jgi:7-keto-8-aminopelargonate synthetase-like enzyme
VPEVSGFGQFEERVRRRLRELEEAGLHRTLQPPSGVDFSSNDYLGLSNHPVLKQRMAEAALAHGCGATASRLLRGERADLSAVEKRFASFKHTEASLYFGSGYAANLSVMETFINRQDVVLSDEHNHASIVDGIRLSRAKRIKFDHCDIDDLARRPSRRSRRNPTIRHHRIPVQHGWRLCAACRLRRTLPRDRRHSDRR